MEVDDTHQQGYPGLIEDEAKCNHLEEYIGIVL